VSTNAFTMPYNTRRKSLSLSSLGIHVPVTHAARAAAAVAAAAAAAATNANTACAVTNNTPGLVAATAKITGNGDTSSSPLRRAGEKDVVRQPPGLAQAPSKRIKRSHNGTAYVSGATPGKYEHTPPPSPGGSSSADSQLDAHDDDDAEISSRRDMKRIKLPEEINDDIVEGVIAQLVATGNRPHLVKELAAVLAQRLTSVTQYVFYTLYILLAHHRAGLPG
jgi:hypothetical protein